MLGLEQATSGEYRCLVHDREEITLPLMIERGSSMLNGSSLAFSKNALRSVECASPRISTEWGCAIRIKEVKPSCNLLLLAEFAIDASRPA